MGGGNHNYHNLSCYTDYWYKRTFGIEISDIEPLAKRTKIGNDVWIAAGVNIISDVCIGDGCVIGAGSVVTKNVLPYSVVVGVPARQIKKRFNDEVIALLESIKWWDWPESKIIENIGLLRNEPKIEELRKIL